MNSINDESFSSISLFLPSLKKLKLKGLNNLSDNGVEAFSLHCPPLLSKISFTSCNFGLKGLVSLLLNCSSIRFLTLKRLRKVDSESVQFPLCFKQSRCQIERLCVKDLHNVGLFIPLVSCYAKTLHSVMVSRSSGNWDRVLDSIKTATSITDIHLDNVQMSDSGLFSISSSCPDLQSLYISRLSDCTDTGLSSIANSCQKLKKIHVDSWRFGSRAIGDVFITSLSNKCTNLQEIVLMGVQTSVESLESLAENCRCLERMAICNTDSVGDREMRVIGEKFVRLKKLCVKNCPISETGVRAVVDGCPSLVKLKVKRCRGVGLREAKMLMMVMQRRSLVVSVDVVAGTEEGLEEERRIETSSNGLNSSRRSSSSIDVICSFSLKSRFENALQLNSRR